eukprot:3936496-Rhodomonas_salina.1
MAKTKQTPMNATPRKQGFTPPKLPSLEARRAQKEAAAAAAAAKDGDAGGGAGAASSSSILTTEDAGGSSSAAVTLGARAAGGGEGESQQAAKKKGKSKGIQKGKVGKGKLSYAKRKKISQNCKGKGKLTLEEKFEIYRLHKKERMTSSKLAEKFDINERTVRKICLDKQYTAMTEASNAGLDVSK